MKCATIMYRIPVTSPEGRRDFQEINVPTFRDNGIGWW